jgi:hypothetical protein
MNACFRPELVVDLQAGAIRTADVEGEVDHLRLMLCDWPCLGAVELDAVPTRMKVLRERSTGCHDLKGSVRIARIGSCASSHVEDLYRRRAGSWSGGHASCPRWGEIAALSLVSRRRRGGLICSCLDFVWKPGYPGRKSWDGRHGARCPRQP